ncbi:MAG: hypothetical protein GQ564_23980 [Bacteroidales bacterium]|nr:hypothetical protein [Bacteroidales bacterium]
MENIAIQNKLEGRQIHFPVLNPTEDFEYWNFNIKTENGEFVKIKFSVNETFTVPVESGVEIKFIDKDGSEISNSLLAGSEKVSFDTENCNIEIDGNWCKNRGDYYELFVKINNKGVHLKLFPLFPDWSNGENGIINKNIIGTRFIAWNFPISHARVEGIFYKNGIEENINGVGTLDHSWGNEYLGVDFKQFLSGNCFLNESVWFYYIALLRDGTMETKLINIDKDGVKFNYLNDFNNRDIDLEISGKIDENDIYPNIPQLISLKIRNRNIDFRINITKQISKDLNINNGRERTNFTSEINLTLKDISLKKIFKTTSITEFYTFL